MFSLLNVVCAHVCDCGIFVCGMCVSVCSGMCLCRGKRRTPHVFLCHPPTLKQGWGWRPASHRDPLFPALCSAGVAAVGAAVPGFLFPEF